ncbi:hypothetical protein Sste5346_005001 [Sporothrix stenoceras]|uniref:Chromo domain-containing protein n=1 Tax=Sporothrix stenoceras TaxID=5173 RepID=A0ABR3Z7V5_9PEZI
MPRPRRVDPPPPSSSTTLSSFAPTSFYSSLTAATTSTSSSHKSKQKQRPNTQLRVLLYDKPIYRTRSDALQPPISLAPPRDDDNAAFIVDKVVTPFDWGGPPAVNTNADLGIDPREDDDDYDTDEEEEKEDERYRQNPERQQIKRVLNYVVGWPDEPYARQLVPCTQILEYVSPRVLEDWEYALTERQRAAREARREEKRAELLAKKKGKLKEEDDVVMGDVLREVAPAPPKKKPGRPTQTAAATAARVAAAAARKEAAAKGLPPPPKTPKKTKPMAMSSMTMAVPTPGGPADRSKRPGSSLSARSSLTGLQIQLDSTPMTVSIGGPPPNPFSSPTSTEKTKAGPSLKRPFQKFVEQQVADDSESRSASLGVETATTNMSAIEEEVADSDGYDQLQRPVIRPPQPPQPHSMSMLPSLRGTPPVQHQPSQRSQPSQSQITSQTLAPTYIPPPDVPHAKQPKQSMTPGPQQPPTTQPPATLKRKRSEETPIPPSATPTTQQPPPPAPLQEQAAADLQQPDPEEEEQDLYEVDQLEGDCMTVVDEGGNPIDENVEDIDLENPPPPPPGSRVARLFLVRWKGDWPPDQNPTWEPAENLPPRMVRQYLKRAAQKQATDDNKSKHEHVEGHARP